MRIPDDWLSETALAAEIGVARKDRSKFHRNLLNWRHRDKLPSHHDGLPVPLVRHRGGRVGNEAFYPPSFIAKVRAIKRPDPVATETRWQVFLDGGDPDDIVKWCREQLLALITTIAGCNDNQLRECMRVLTRKPTKRSDPRRSFYRRLKAYGWSELTKWAVSIGAGLLIQQSVFDSVSPPRQALAKLMGRSESSIGDCLAGSSIETMRLAQLVAVLDDLNASELERVRMDLRACSRAGERRDLVGFVLSRIWRRHDVRAGLLPGLVICHRSLDHQGDLAMALGLAAESNGLPGIAAEAAIAVMSLPG